MTIHDLRHMVQVQAEDEGIWFIAETAPEAHLQSVIRELHAAVEGLDVDDGVPF